MHVQFVYCTSLPDLAGGRRMHQLADAVADKDVAKILFHHHQQYQGRDVPYLSPLQSMLAVAAVLELRDGLPQLRLHHCDDRSEMELLAWLIPQLGRCPTYCWNEHRELKQLLHARALIHQEPWVDVQLLALDAALDLDTTQVSLLQLAQRLGCAPVIMPSDETNWDLYRRQGMTPLLQQNLSGLQALTQLGLRHLLLSQVLDEPSYDELLAACEALSWSVD
jgi:hypothetical protein